MKWMVNKWIESLKKAKWTWVLSRQQEKNRLRWLIINPMAGFLFQGSDRIFVTVIYFCCEELDFNKCIKWNEWMFHIFSILKVLFYFFTFWQAWIWFCWLFWSNRVQIDHFFLFLVVQLHSARSFYLHFLQYIL